MLLLKYCSVVRRAEVWDAKDVPKLTKRIPANEGHRRDVWLSCVRFAFFAINLYLCNLNVVFIFITTNFFWCCTRNRMKFVKHSAGRICIFIGFTECYLTKLFARAKKSRFLLSKSAWHLILTCWGSLCRTDVIGFQCFCVLNPCVWTKWKLPASEWKKSVDFNWETCWKRTHGNWYKKLQIRDLCDWCADASRTRAKKPNLCTPKHLQGLDSL